MPRRLLVTPALPYANGDLHIGHLVEHVQTDVWVRFQRLRGVDCRFVCADDAHGTAIMLRAQREGRTPQQLIDAMREAHVGDLAGFSIVFDNYHTTHSSENRRLVEEIYERLRAGGHIVRRPVRQAFDEEMGIFLADRYIKGTCPVCKSPEQYGDSCEVCGSTYSPAELIDARSTVSGKPPVERESEHVFFKLGDFADFLRDWIASDALQPEVRNKLEEWFAAGLKDWDVSRDAPYWGFEIPDAPGKYFYVWLDAPVGYMASFRQLCEREGLDFDAYWRPGSDAQVVHFVGKDIQYFHTLFWPAMLHGGGFRTPTAVYVHGFLTVEGQKMSKSRGTFIRAATYLEHLDPEALRYYFAAKLGPGVDDLDLNFDDFVQRVNSDLVGKLVNIASRSAAFVHKHFGGRLAAALPAPELRAELRAAADGIAQDYEARRFSKAVRTVMALADRVNQYIDERKPWIAARDPARLPEVHGVVSQGLDLYKLLITYLKPILPRTAERSEAFLRCGPLDWASLDRPLVDQAIAPFEPLIQRIERARVDAMIDASRAEHEEASPPSSAPATATAPSPTSEETPTLITIDQFMATELKVATVVAAEAVPKSNKLLKLTVDAGDEGGPRTVVAGIAQAYPPESLLGKQVVVVANLQPAKLMGVESNGMVLAASEGGVPVLLHPARPVPNGTRVR